MSSREEKWDLERLDHQSDQRLAGTLPNDPIPPSQVQSPGRGSRKARPLPSAGVRG